MRVIREAIEYQFLTYTQKAFYIQLLIYSGTIVAPFITILVNDKDTKQAQTLRNIVSAGTVLFAFVEGANLIKQGFIEYFRDGTNFFDYT